MHCHREPAPKGGLSLTTAAGAMKGGESGAAFIPKQPDQSLIVQHITGPKPEMPKNADPLLPADIAAIRDWIASGAPWPADLKLVDKRASGPWWSLQPIAANAAGQSTIDAFIAAKLTELGLAPSPEADRRTLIRRLTFDLHGLPSTPDEIAAFLADDSPAAYETLVNRLLASPRYGERWGRHWLDVVHFGESHGYDKDKPRPNAWPYRDYVIRSLNADKPYSRFVQEQLAGDVLFPDDPDGVAATGFIATGPWDFVGHVELREGTVDKRIARSNDRDDMVQNAMSTFLSLTVHCARCHDHKFDPIPQADYYKLQAVFAGIDRADRPYDADPHVHAARRRLAAEKQLLDERRQAIVARAEQSKSPELKSLDAKLAEMRQQLAALPVAAGKESPTNGYHSAIMPRPEAEKWVQVDLGKSLPIDDIRLIPARPTDFRDSPGFGFPLRYRIDVSDDATFAARQCVVDRTSQDVANPGDVPVSVSIAQSVAIRSAGGSPAQTGGPPVLRATARYVRVTATRLWQRSNDYVFALAEMQVVSSGKNVALAASVSALDSIDAGRWHTRHLVDGFSSRSRLEDATDENARKRLAMESEIRAADEQRNTLFDALLDDPTRKELAGIVARLVEIAQSTAKLPPPQMVYAAATRFAAQGGFTQAEVPRPVHLLLRGDVKTPGPLMSAGSLSCVTALPSDFELPDADDEGSRRAALARWITDARNPLPRRSIVNRVWHYHFGRGLVETPNDFGRMGSKPTHPELLDWLTSEFQKNGESLKWLHRQIVASAVYRQRSSSHASHAKIDSGNRFLWRMERSRLDAESLRDSILAVSGKLDLAMGGPSLQQFQFKNDHSPVYDYTSFDVDSPGSLRRSVYRFIVRSVPDPFMETFDCADHSICTPKRNTTLTALQALALLNNPFVVRQSEHFAQRLQARSCEPGKQIEFACELAYGRPPRKDEATLLESYAKQHGLMNVCRLIFNSNEFMFVD